MKAEGEPVRTGRSLAERDRGLKEGSRGRGLITMCENVLVNITACSPTWKPKNSRKTQKKPIGPLLVYVCIRSKYMLDCCAIEYISTW